ncbi:RnfABCDGE type electron transport complex subunit G [Prevotella sp. HCN-7019]|uniref:RnfABCDGE type electron transport complex subunit G n=1 Tax=Prevotella sp. HCN-7019 TaxID=3134668 RepID=UPI0030BE825A
MEKLKSSFRNMSLVLVAVAVITGALLAFMNHITEEPIRIQADKVLSDGIKDVMCNNNIFVDSADTIVMDNNDKKELFVVYRILGWNRDNAGVAIESSVMGFGGEMKVLVGFDAKAKILGYTILQSSETPGLGTKADKWFAEGGKGNIIGHDMSDGKPLVVKKDGGTVDAITASTITTRAFLKAVNQAYSVYADYQKRK